MQLGQKKTGSQLRVEGELATRKKMSDPTVDLQMGQKRTGPSCESRVNLQLGQKRPDPSYKLRTNKNKVEQA